MAFSADDDERPTLDGLLKALAHAPRLPLAPEPAERMPGQRIGPYALQGLIAEGGMGAVYRAHDGRLGRDVALKLVRSPHLRPDLVQRFMREARALAALASPHVVTIYDLGMHEAEPFLAMELLSGETVRKRLRAGLPSLDETIRIMGAVLDGLCAVHERGIVHRDLKPENVFLCEGGTVKLLDFGLVKVTQTDALSASAESTATQTGVIMGTAAYMAPEQIHAREVGPECDLFAFGVMFYELLSGRVPFQGQSSFEIMHRILTAEPTPLDVLDPKIPGALASVVERCLQKDRASRFATAALARSALVSALSGVASQPRKIVRSPVLRYAKSGGIHLGYQVAGEGPPDLVIVPGFVSSIEQLWEDPDSRRFFEHLSDACRLIMFDKRNTGVSDRVMGAGTMEERVADLIAVLDAAESKQPVLMGVSEGVSISIACAVAHPERVRALVLYAGFAHHARSKQLSSIQSWVEHSWGEGNTLALFAPSVAHDPDKRAWWGRWERLGANPAAMAAHLELLERIDVRSLLPQVSVPTLILHRKDDRVVPVEASRRLAAAIPGARLVLYDGEDHAPMLGDTQALLEDLISFLAANKAGP